MSKEGRPTKYKQEYCEQAEKLCKKGFIDYEIADFFNVSVSTLNTWKKVYPDFLSSIKEAKAHSDDKVVNALYNRAMGYQTVEVKQEDGDQGSKTTTITKQLSGDVGAMCFWLKNRQPAQWREKSQVEHSLSDDFEDLMSSAVNDKE